MDIPVVRGRSSYKFSPRASVKGNTDAAVCRNSCKNMLCQTVGNAFLETGAKLYCEVLRHAVGNSWGRYWWQKYWWWWWLRWNFVILQCAHTLKITGIRLTALDNNKRESVRGSPAPSPLPRPARTLWMSIHSVLHKSSSVSATLTTACTETHSEQVWPKRRLRTSH
jgi:hypothetical protein